jgi:hypothetical protein
VNTLAPSIAAAFLGLLAFVGWLLWLRRTDERRNFVQEVAKLQASVRASDEAGGALYSRLEKRVLKLEQRAAGLGPVT